MTALKNDRFLRALLKQPVDVTPVWMMRQAGRYLPEYRATRAKAGDFVRLMKNPELACEVTIQPLDRYPQLDASILFSDILTIPDAMGQGLYFETGEGPRFQKVITSLADIEALPIPDPEKDLGSAVCFVPGLVYDKAGYRLGYGKGFYDRYLSHFSGCTLGVVDSDYILPTVPRGRFDVSVNILLTEKGVKMTGEA